MDQATAVRTLVEPALTAQGIDLFDVEYSGGRLVVTVDRDGGIDLETLTTPITSSPTCSTSTTRFPTTVSCSRCRARVWNARCARLSTSPAPSVKPST